MDKFNPNENLINMITKNFFWGLLGIVLGVIINIIIQHNPLNIGKSQFALRMMLQLLICSFALAFIHIKINNEFGWTWQNITPGLFFVSYFFGTQFATFSNIQQINDKIYNMFI